MTYQDWCIATIKVILGMKNRDEGQYGYKMIVKDIIRHYPEVFVVDGEQVHFWTKAVSHGCIDQFRRSFVKSFLMTQKAYDIAIRGSVETLRSYLYQEHITPVQHIFKNLQGLLSGSGKIGVDDIKDCMIQNKLVLMHVDERKKLDGKRFTDKDFSYLQKVVTKVQHKLVDADGEIQAAKTLIGESSRDHGSGLFRICKLLASGVHFYDSSGKECSNARIVELLVGDVCEYASL